MPFEVEDLAHVGVGDLAREVDLLLEAGDHGLVGGDGRQQGLEGDMIGQERVFGLVDFPHAAAAKVADNAVAAGDELSGGKDRHAARLG